MAFEVSEQTSESGESGHRRGISELSVIESWEFGDGL